MHQYKGALVLPIAVPDQSSAVIPRLVLLLFVRQTRPLGKLKNVPLAAQRLFLLQDAASAGQQVLTRSNGEGACLEPLGMCELFLSPLWLGWGDSTGMCSIELALFNAA